MDKKVLLMLCVLASCLVPEGFVQADDPMSGVLPMYSSSQGKYFDKKTNKERSSFSRNISILSAEEGSQYQITEHGQGDYGIYKDIIWDGKVDAMIKDGLLQPLSSSRIIKQKDGKVLIDYEKEFDYINKKVNFTAKDSDGKITSKAKYSIRGPITDDALMIYFLIPYASHHGQKQFSTFYLITDEPSMYFIRVRDQGKETLALGQERIETIKLRIIPDFGLLTGLVKAIVPPTYLWFKDEPCVWLKYDGLECGLGTTLIISEITRH